MVQGRVLPVEPQFLSLVTLKDGVHLLPALCSEVGRSLAAHLWTSGTPCSSVVHINWQPNIEERYAATVYRATTEHTFQEAPGYTACRHGGSNQMGTSRYASRVNLPAGLSKASALPFRKEQISCIAQVTLATSGGCDCAVKQCR